MGQEYSVDLRIYGSKSLKWSLIYKYVDYTQANVA